MSDYLSSQSYKGTRDFYPEEMRFRRWMFECWRKVVSRFGYEEYDGPMLEPFELYAAKSGEEIVNQQLYWLVDRGERKLAIRPEMTPTLARIVAAKINELPRPIRYFSIPNLWRYERPQRGRLREHWQLNVDLLGADKPDERIRGDAEILRVALALVKEVGGEALCELRVNHRGLVDEFFNRHCGLSAEQAHTAVKALDARDKIGEEKYFAWLKEAGIADAATTKLEVFFKWDFASVQKNVPCAAVDELSALFTELPELIYDPKIMRGMNYYTGTVFELYDKSPENRRAMFGGGRYDNLVGLFGKHTVTGVGFGMGDVGFENFLETHGLKPKLSSGMDVVVSLPSAAFAPVQAQISEELRAKGISVCNPLSVGKFADHLKYANRVGVRFAVLLGEREWEQKKIVLKDLVSGAQEEVLASDLTKELTKKLKEKRS